MDKSIIRALVVFAGWTITSFLCHYCAKLFLRESADLFAGKNLNVILLTSMQIAFCLILRPVSNTSEKNAAREKYIILIAHACATLATNYSMAVTHAASTFAIKLTEPLTGALAQKLFLGINLSTMQWLSIPVTVYGAVAFAEDTEHDDFKISLGTVLAFMSNVCLALRNVIIKKKHQSNTEIAPNDKPYCVGLTVFCSLGVLVLYYLSVIEITPSRSFYLCALVITSSIFHVLYSYISTVTVLKQFSVVSHAFVNIMKRLIVICLLYMTGSRSASTWNFIGLFICSVGLSVYIWSKIQASSNSMENLSKYTGQVTKAFFMISFTIVVTIVFISQSIYHGLPKKIGSGDHLLSVRHLDGSRDVIFSKPITFDVDEFLVTDLVNHPEEANKLSPLLATRPDVINEAQRIHMNVFQSEIGSYKYAMLFDYDTTENKGDPAIAVGEMILLHKLNIEVIFSCPAGSCDDKTLDEAFTLSKNYSNKDLVILFHGGGNVISSRVADDRRFLEMERFRDFHIVMFPQGILFIGEKTRIDSCRKKYESHGKLTVVWRDMNSFQLGRKLFPNIRSLLAPDMAYQIGFVPRYMPPTHDIIWLKRSDTESPNYEVPEAPSGYRMHVSDWLDWETSQSGSPVEQVFLITTNGLIFMQRGRVVITDRLHGHIFSTLLGIPHVYIDNKHRKISNYHNTWTAGLENVILANSSTDALVQAKNLLAKLDNGLPKITGYFD